MKFWRTIVIVGFALNLLLTACIPGKPSPTVTISDNVEDENGDPIAKNSAPFKIRVNGTVSNAEDLYLYLVVNDGNAAYIQPEDLVLEANGAFEGYCYLGIGDDPESLNKEYEIFAVVTETEYDDYKHLDQKTVKARSNTISATRTR
jgi:hypothetical protein